MSKPINRAIRNYIIGVPPKVSPAFPPQAPPVKQFPTILWCSAAPQCQVPQTLPAHVERGGEGGLVFPSARLEDPSAPPGIPMEVTRARFQAPRAPQGSRLQWQVRALGLISPHMGT